MCQTKCGEYSVEYLDNVTNFHGDRIYMLGVNGKNMDSGCSITLGISNIIMLWDT